MTQTIEFNCKHEDAGKPCPGKAIYTPDELPVIGYMTTAPSPTPYRTKPSVPSASSRMQEAYLTCDRGHGAMYRIVKFACQKPKCHNVVVGTGEKPPICQEDDKQIKGGEVTLTCDIGHQYTYHVLK
jgi:hypothetical protein